MVVLRQNLGYNTKQGCGKMDIENIAKTIEAAGGRLYLVGGALRDQMLRKRSVR